MIKNIFVAAAIGFAAIGAQAAGANLLADGNFESTGLSFASGPSYCYTIDTGGAAPACGAVNAGWSSNIYLAADSGPWGNPQSQSPSLDLGQVVVAIQGVSSLTSAFSFVAGQEYTLSFMSTGRANYGGVQDLTVSAGGVALTPVNGLVIGHDGWQTYTYEFVASSNGPLVFQGLTNSDSTAFIDNVSVTAVPEPTSILMMGVATLGLLAWRRRSRG